MVFFCGFRRSSSRRDESNSSSQNNAPPPYIASAPEKSSGLSIYWRRPRITAARTNGLSILESSKRAVQGSWVVDTSLKIAEPLLKPPMHPYLEVPWNLSVTNKAGVVNAKVAAVDNSEKKARAVMRFEGEKGLSLSITKDPGCSVWLDLNSPNSITLHIPPSFKGPIFSRHPRWDGKLIFGPGVEEHLTIFSERMHPAESSYFFGDLEGSGYTEWATWKGDAAMLIAGEGATITVFLSNDS